jgi:hypothetical protein
VSKVKNIRKFKQLRAFEKIVSDIPRILHVLSLTQRGLAVFKAYIPVQEIISVLETNKTLLEIKLCKYQDELEQMKKEYD